MPLRHLGLAAVLLASLGVPAAAQVFVNGAPATIGGVTQFVWNGQNISAANPLPVTMPGGGGATTANQGTAATDTAANRWPVLAYQGGTWSFGLSGPIPSGSNVIGAVTQSGGPWTVSGTVTANLGTLNGAATAAGQAAQQGPVAPGTAAANSVLNGCVYNATAPTLASGQQVAVQCDASGQLKVAGAGGSGGAVTEADGANVALGAKADTAYTGSGTASVIALLKGNYAGLIAPTPAGTNVIGKVGIDQTTPGTTNAVGNQVYDGATWRNLLSTTTGALEPPTAASGKITVTSTALTASTNTTIAAANANRTSMGIQCGSGAVNVSETGATLASATFGATGASLFIPTGSQPYFSPPVTTRTAVTAYTATAQTCVVTEYLR